MLEVQVNVKKMLKFLLNLAKYKKKGAIWGYIIVFVIIVLLEIVVFSTQFHTDVLKERSFIESYYLVKGSQLDTYVKACLSSLQTSLLQAIYDTGCKKDQLWQKYDENLMPKKEELEKETKEKAELYSNISLEILGKNRKGIIVPEKNEIKEVKIEDFVTAFALPVTFNLNKKEINISYTFSPKVEINTSFKKIYEKAEELINGRKIRELVTDAIKKVKNQYNLPDSLSYSAQKCGECPSSKSCESIFEDNTGYTYSEVEEFISKKINETINSFSFEDYFLKIYLYTLVNKSKVEDSKSESCIDTGICCNCAQRNETTGECIVCAANDWKREISCNYYYYGMVEVLVNITENPSNYFNYTLYDSCERNQVIKDNLRLNFRILDGGCKECKPGLNVKDVFP
jgi:hypothetical protein